MSGDSTVCTIRINAGEHEFKVAGGQPLFQALTNCGIPIPTICSGRGVCGQCKVRVFSPCNPPNAKEEKKLSQAELADHWRLSCQVIVESDLDIEIDATVLSQRRLEAKLLSTTILTHDILGLEFALPEELTFKSGQYMQLTIPAYGELKRPVQRAYSLSNPSYDNRKACFCVRRVPQGVGTSYIFDYLKPGMSLTLTGPNGDFYLRDSDCPIVMIGGGSGLSPFHGMILEMVKNKAKRDTCLFFGAVKKQDLYYVDEFSAIAKENPWFHFIPALSGAEECAGNVTDIDYCKKGLITDVVKQHYVNTSLKSSQGYLCGSPGMINACIQVLIGLGMNTDNIFYDHIS